MNKLIVFALLAVCVIGHPLRGRKFSHVSAHKGRDDEKTFYHPQLPCSFIISMAYTHTRVVTGEVVSTGTSKMAMHGTNFYDSYQYKDNDEEPVLYYGIGREDLKDENSFAGMVQVESGDSSCTRSYYSEDDYKTEIGYSLEWFQGYMSYDEEGEEEFQGKKYKYYADLQDDPELYFKLFVDENNYTIGIDIMDKEKDQKLRTIYTVSYKFYAPLSMFVLDQSITTNCTDAAFTAPTEKMCDDPSSSAASSGNAPPQPSGGQSQPSMAATAEVTIAMILVSIAAALLSIF